MAIDLRPPDKGAAPLKNNINISLFTPAPKPVFSQADVLKLTPVKQIPVKPFQKKTPPPVKKTALEKSVPEPKVMDDSLIPDMSVSAVQHDISEDMPVKSAVFRQVSTSGADIPSVEDVSGLKLKYRDRVRDIIASNKTYPPKARRRGVQGSVTVAFSVHMNGDVTNSYVVDSSGFDILDKTALRILSDSSPLPVPPEQMDFSLPISFVLN